MNTLQYSERMSRKRLRIILYVSAVFCAWFVLSSLFSYEAVASIIKSFAKETNQSRLLVLLPPIKEHFLNKMISGLIVFIILAPGIIMHMREIKAETKNLLKTFHTDIVTGLPNRLKLLEDLSSMQGNKTAFLIDIDSFKEIYNFYGLSISDDILYEMGEVITRIFPFDDYRLYNYSVDQFVIIVPKHMNQEEIKMVVVILHNLIKNESFSSQGEKVSLTATVSGAAIQHTGIQEAELALDFARKERKGYAVYDPERYTIKKYEENIHWTGRLRSAIEDDRVYACFQPIVRSDASPGEIHKFECLVRLRDKQDNIFSPTLFLDVAKRSKMYTLITRIMIESAFEKFMGTPYQFSVNLCIEDIMDDFTIKRITKLLETYQNGAQVVFEIVESEDIKDYNHVKDFIQMVKAYGCQIAIDDFGTGYSNFEHVLELDVDYIKIDGSLIRNIDTDHNSQVIVETIMTFCKKLNIQTIAEYVHNAEVQKKVREIGVDFMQGYHIGKPSESLPVITDA